MRTLFVSLLLCSSCSDRCKKADYTTDGICVITNGYKNISEEEISWAIGATQDEVNARRPGLNLPELLKGIPASLAYTSKLPETSQDHGGVTINEQDVYIKWSADDRNSEGDCVLHTNIVMHELLHIIAIDYWDATNEQNKDHNIPGLFLPKDCENHSCSSVEGDMWLNEIAYCK